MLREIKATIQLIYGLMIGVPLLVLQQLGVNVIPSFFSFNIPLCSLCICGAILGVTSSVGIGLGVGLGVGLSCTKTDDIIYNDTNTNSFNNITTTTTTISTISSSTRFATAQVPGTLPDGTIDANSRNSLANSIATSQGLPSGSVTVTNGVVSSNGGRRKRRGLLERSERQTFKTLTFSYVYNLIICGGSCTSAVLISVAITLTQVTLTVGGITITITTLSISVTATTITAGPTVVSTSTTVKTATIAAGSVSVVNGVVSS